MLKIGDTILQRYRIVDSLPEGGQCWPGIAYCIKTGDRVFVKKLKLPARASDVAVAIARFDRERSLRFGHPRVVEAIDSGEENGDHYIILPFIEGLTLERMVRDNGGPLDPSIAATIATQIAEGLDAIHRHDKVHRDIKPSNIIMHQRDGAHIIDLGICRDITEATLTQDQCLLGSPAWMSPEQVMDATRVESRADLFALGGVLYFMLTAFPPIEAVDARIFAAQLFSAPPPSPASTNPRVTPELDRLCRWLLARDPSQRPQNASAVIDAIARGHTGTSATPPVASHCAACGQRFDPAVAFCMRCGASASTSLGVAARCLACGKPAGAGSRCASCGLDFSPEEHQLQFSAGPAAGSVFRIPQGAYIVGRAQICPRDVHVSSRQLSIFCNNGSVVIQHVGTAVNMTQVNRSPATNNTLLGKDAEVRFARCVATYIRS